MNEQATTVETVLLPESDLVPLALLAVEVGEPVDRIVPRFGDEITVDDVGMRAVSASATRRFFTERAEQKARQDEAARRCREEKAPQPKPAPGVPAPEGAESGVEALMMSAGWESPTDEFGRPSPNFLEEELAAGRRAAAEKERRVEQMKKDLQ